MSMNELFNTEGTKGRRELDGTAELTRVSAAAANAIIARMDADIDKYRPIIGESARDHVAMDKLLDDMRPWCDIEEDDPLNHLDEDLIDNMLRSQQSKRSRCKAKEMTLDNYRAMMTAAIAENLLREIYNKPKTHVFGARKTGTVDFTPAELEKLAANQDELGKAIRNIQSKKSIMKKKDDFDESDERWQALLKYEAVLKDLRVEKRETLKNKLTDALGDINLKELSVDEARELLNSLKDLVD